MNIIYGHIGNNISSNINRISEQLQAEGAKYGEKQDINFHFGNTCFNPDYPLTIAAKDDIVVTCDCLLTNKKELYQKLDISPYTNDADLILSAYIKWGEELPKHIEGDFAIVIYNKNKEETFILRDHLGIKPLYYFEDGEEIIFSTDYHLLIDNGLVKANISRKNLYAQIDNTYGNTFNSIPFDNIYRVKPATYLKKNGKTKALEVKYWNPIKDVKINKERTLTQTVRELEELLIKTVERRSKEDKIGVHLSGGVDSGSIAAIVSNLKKETIKAYSWSPDPQWVEKHVKPDVKLEEYSEYKFINSFLKKYHFDLWYSRFSKEEAYTFMTDPDYFLNPELEIPVARQIKKDNISLILSGWGGDEFFSSRNQIIWYDYFTHPYGIFRLLYFLKKDIRFTISKILYLSKILLIPRFIKKLKIKQHIKKQNLFKDKQLRDHIHKDKQTFRYQFFQYGKNKIMQHRLNLNYLSIRTEVWNKKAYRHGTEYSFPLLDKNLIEFMFSIPAKQMISIKYNRLLVRLACRNILPKEVLRSNCKPEYGRFNFSAHIIKQSRETILEKLKEAQDCKLLEGINITKAISNIETKNDYNLINIYLYTGLRIIKMHNFIKKHNNHIT